MDSFEKDCMIRNLQVTLDKHRRDNEKLNKDNVRFRAAVFAFLEVMSDGDIESLLKSLKERDDVS